MLHKTLYLNNLRKSRTIVSFSATLFLLLFLSFPCFSQSDADYTNARNRLVKILKRRTIDPVFTQSIDRFYTNSCDSLLKLNQQMNNRTMRFILTRLFEATEQKLNNGSITSLRVTAVNNYFLQTLKTYKKQSIIPLYRQISLTQSSILDYTFDGTSISDSIGNVVGIREMLNAPYLISTRLYQPRYAPFRDTLLYFLANEQPEILIQKLADGDSMITALVKRTRNTTVKAVAQVQKDNYYDKTLPFGLAILENRTTAEDVRKLTMEPELYYKTFVDEVIRLHTDKNFETRSYLEKPIAALNASLADKFYIREMNDLHESPDNIRFKRLNNRTPRELYFLLVGGTGELYTSSILYLFQKFIKDTEKEGLEQFFADIDYYGFDQFISNIAGYGLADDLAQHMKPETVARLFGRSLSKLSSSQLTDNEIILQAMTMSDVFYSFRQRPELRDLLVKQIDNFKNPKIAGDLLLQRLYSGLRGVLLDKNDYKSVSNYDVLPVSRLKRNNSIVQACFFYDDDDGANSFAGSTATYSPALWTKEDKGNYIVFVSKQGNNMRVYMNKPNTKAGCDTAQNIMLADISRDGYEPTSFIHRGHSYYLTQSLKKIGADAQFVFLGSCGGYNEVLQLFRQNPDMNIISTRNIGSTQINDPMLQQINTELVNNRDIVWAAMWKNFDAKFQSKLTKDLFSAYISPDKYIGVKFIRKVFNF